MLTKSSGIIFSSLITNVFTPNFRLVKSTVFANDDVMCHACSYF